MVLEKRYSREPELPVSIKNKLRGSRSSVAAVADLRATINVDLFPALLKKLPHFPYRGRTLLPSQGASLQRFRTDLPIFHSIALHRELAWSAAIFRQNAEVLARFIDLKSQFESSLLLGNFDNCDEVLDRLENEFGFSIWLLEMKIAFRQSCSGLEAQKAYSSQVRSIRRDGDLISFLAHFMSWRNEDTTNPFQFKKTVSEMATDWDVHGDFRTYVLYKLTGECALDDVTLSAILRYEASYSLIDYYESFIRLAIKHLSSDRAEFLVQKK